MGVIDKVIQNIILKIIANKHRVWLGLAVCEQNVKRCR